jgi:hypothetical protein
VLDRFDVTGGGLLAAGIAFNALFAIIPWRSSRAA